MLVDFTPSIEERYLARIIAHAPLDADGYPEGTNEETLFNAAVFNGVTAIAHHQGTQHPQRERIPTSLIERLAHQSRGLAAIEMIQRQTVQQTLTYLAQAGLQFLITKGAALAYELYPQSHLRERCDVDILLPDRTQADQAATVLHSLGFTAGTGVEGDLYNYEKTYIKTLPVGGSLALDLHWRAFNNNIYRDSLRFDRLITQARPIPALGTAARTLSLSDALLYAAIHRLGHAAEGSANRLIWLYDIALLCRAMQTDDWQQLLRNAQDTGTAHACLDAIEAAVQAFSDPSPPAELGQLQQIASRERVSKQFLAGPVSKTLGDIRALPTWNLRLRLIGQHLFPAATYMRRKYPESQKTPLLWLYARRIFNGLLRTHGRRS